MAIGFETTQELLRPLPQNEAKLIYGIVQRIGSMLDMEPRSPVTLDEDRPYDEETAHLRLLQHHQDAVHGMHPMISDAGRKAILEIAIEFGAANELPGEVIEANWLTASREERA